VVGKAVGLGFSMHDNILIIFHSTSLFFLCILTFGQVIFLETICNDLSVIETNIRLKIQQSPDYADSPDYEVALEDFKTRLFNYEKVYECIYMYINSLLASCMLLQLIGFLIFFPCEDFVGHTAALLLCSV
jgi:hypothetical protein